MNYAFRSKNGVEIKEIKELEGRVQIYDKENKLIIPRPTVTDAGNYTCSIPELKLSSEINVVGEWSLIEATLIKWVRAKYWKKIIFFAFSANVYIHKIPDNIAVVEGEKLQLHCKVYGSEPIEIIWTIGKLVHSKKKLNKINASIISTTEFRRRFRGF